MLRRNILLAFVCFAFSIFPSSSFAAIEKESAYQLAEAYQMEGVSGAVRSMVADGVRKELESKIKEWTVEAVSESGYFGSSMTEREQKKLAIKKKLKEKLQKNLPQLAKKVLYEKLFLGEFGDEVGEVKEIVNRVISELQVTFNERADQFIAPWYDKAISEIDEYLKYEAGPITADLTDIRGTLDRALKLENIEWGLEKALSESIGESTAAALKNRIKDVLQHQLPPEAIKYLDYGPEKFAEYAAKAEEYLPGKKIDELKEKLLHKPLFVVPNGIYCGILAAAASKHFAAAYKGAAVDAYELKRGIEVSKVMVWQAKNKEGLSVDTAMFLDIIKNLSNTFGVSLDNLGAIGDGIGKLKGAFDKLEKNLDKLDSLIKGNLDKAQDLINGTVDEIKTTLTKIQDTLFKPVTEAYDLAKRGMAKANSAVMSAIPENIHGVPGNWDDFKDQFGIKPGIFGKAGELSPWDIMHNFAEKSGLMAAYEKFKKDMLRTANDINDAISGGLAAAGAEVVDAFGLTDYVARALKIEYVPEKNPSLRNPTDPVLLHNGEYYYQMTDLLIPAKGLHYEFKRTYRSRANFKGTLGFNWSHNYDVRLVSDGKNIFYLDGEGKSFRFDCSDRKMCRSEGLSLFYAPDSEYPFYIEDDTGSKKYFGRLGLLAAIEDTQGDRLLFDYDEYNRLVKVVEPQGREIKYIYDSRGLLKEIEDFLGRRVRFEYNDYDDLTAATGPVTFDYPEGKTTRYEYSSGYYEEGDLSHNLMLIMDPKGQIYIKNKYSEDGADYDMVVSQQYGDKGTPIRIAYNKLRPAYLLRFISAEKNLPVDEVTVVDRRGVVHYYSHNAWGGVIKDEYEDENGRKRPVTHRKEDVTPEKSAGSGATYEYDQAGNIVAAIDRYGNKTTYLVNAIGQVVQENSPEPYSYYKKYFFDANDNLTEIRIENRGGLNDAEVGSELVYKYKYGELDNLTEINEPVSKNKYITTKFEYDPEGRLVRKILPEGNSARYEYDAGGNLVRIIRGDGAETQVLVLKYDENGVPSGMVDPSGKNRELKREGLPDEDNSQKYEDGLAGAEIKYDEVGRIIEIKDPLGGKNKIGYDSRSNVVLIEDSAGGRTDYLYDGLGRRIETRQLVENGKYIVTKYEWDGNGRLKSLTDGSGRAMHFSYDSLNRLVSQKYPDGGEIKYQYDELDNPVKVTEGNGTSVEQKFDENGQILERKITRAAGVHGTTLQKFEYDEKGRLVYSFDNNDPDDPGDDSEVKYIYNDKSELVSEVQNGRQINKNYDTRGRVNIIKYPSGGSVHVKYREDGRAESFFWNGGFVARYGYDSAGRVSDRETGGRIISKYQYNELGNLLSQTLSAENSKIAGIEMKYDSVGRIAMKTGLDGKTVVYDYDKAGRLNSYRASKKDLQYDKNGNLKSDDRFRYYYDGLNRLREVRTREGKIINKYSYDAHNRRLSKSGAGGGRLQFVYDGWNLIGEYKDKNPLRTYVYSDQPDVLIAVIDHSESGKKFYAHQDYQKSVVAVSDEEGNIFEKYSYSPFGLVEGGDNLKTPLSFAAQYADSETGLIYFRNRYYSPKTGEFITRDPMGQKVDVLTDSEGIVPYRVSYHRRGGLAVFPNHFGWLGSGFNEGVATFNRYFRRPFAMRRLAETNPYEYAAGDPVNRSDPLGLDYLWVTGEYRLHKGGNSSGRYADLDVIWVEESTSDGVERARILTPVYHGVSGPWGRGPLPPGDYTGHTIRKRADNNGMIIEGFGWSLNIDPEFKTDRSLLRIHPDGNNFGSLGCIAIDKEGYIGLYERLNEYLKTNKEIDVNVRINNTWEKSGDAVDNYIRSHVDMISKTKDG